MQELRANCTKNPNVREQQKWLLDEDGSCKSCIAASVWRFHIKGTLKGHSRLLSELVSHTSQLASERHPVTNI